MTSDLTIAVLEAIDTLNAKSFAEFFAPDGKITFGNNAPIAGRETVEAATGAFLETIDAINHRIVNEWVVAEDVIVELSVTYSRKDRRKVTIPVVAIWTYGDGGLITTYRVFFD